MYNLCRQKLLNKDFLSKDIKSKISNVFNPKQSLSQDFYQEQERANINLREVIGEWNCGENAKAKLESGSGVLTISGTGAMNPADNFGNQCQQVAQGIQGINQGIELVIH